MEVTDVILSDAKNLGRLGPCDAPRCESAPHPRFFVAPLLRMTLSINTNWNRCELDSAGDIQERNSKDIAERVAGLARCVEAFHERFGVAGPSTQEELLSRIPIQEEEVRELRDALLHEEPERVASEATDVLFVAIGTLLRLDPGLVEAAIDEVIDKNDAKTMQTHHINVAGKIVRRAGEDPLP